MTIERYPHTDARECAFHEIIVGDWFFWQNKLMIKTAHNTAIYAVENHIYNMSGTQVRPVTVQITTKP
jgi:hypothetical protein